MHEQSSPEKSEEDARLDGAILGLLVSPHDQRPWSDDEIAREVSTPGDVSDALIRLQDDGLVHRWDRLASATHPAVRYFRLTQSTDSPITEADRLMELAILEALLTPASRRSIPMSETELRRDMGIKKKERLDFIDALSRLGRCGLVARTRELVFATKTAARFDEIFDA